MRDAVTPGQHSAVPRGERCGGDSNSSGFDTAPVHVHTTVYVGAQG